MRILIVEDDSRLLTQLDILLQKNGYSVDLAGHGIRDLSGSPSQYGYPSLAQADHAARRLVDEAEPALQTGVATMVREIADCEAANRLPAAMELFNNKE